MKDKLKKYLLPNLPYLFFVYLFDKLCQAVRLVPGLDASEKLLHIGQGFQTAFAAPHPAFTRWISASASSARSLSGWQCMSKARTRRNTARALNTALPAGVRRRILRPT